MIQTLFVPGPLPGLNDVAGKKSRWHYRQLKEEWGLAIGIFITLAKLTPMQRVSIVFHWQEKNQRRDPDNIMFGQKFCLDALVAKGILPDDGWAEIAGLAHTFAVVPMRPGVRMEIVEVVND